MRTVRSRRPAAPRLMYFFLIAGVGAASTSRAVDATAATQSTDALAEIVVTAQYRRQNLQDTPIAITAVTGEAIEQKSQQTMVDLTEAAPNVTLTHAGSGFGNSATASIRGVGQSDFNFALDPGVGIYIDDVYYGVIFGSVFDLADLDRVEILRGPQGTLSVANSIGGAIKLYTEKPNGDDSGYLEATAGTFNRREFRGAGDFTVVPDQLFVRVSGSSKQVDGYMTRLDYGCAKGTASPTRVTDNCVIGTEGGIDSRTLRASVLWKPTDGIEDNLIADSLDDDSETPAEKLLVQGPWAGSNNYITASHSYTNYATYTGLPGTAGAFQVPDTDTVHGYGVSNNLVLKLPAGMTGTWITSFRRSTGTFGSDVDASPADVETSLNEVSHKQYTEEVRLSGKSLGAAIDWTVGGYYYDAHDTIAGRIDIPGGLVPGGGVAVTPFGTLGVLDVIDNDLIVSESTSGFANAEFHATDALSVITGLRYTHESKDYYFGRDSSGLPPTLFSGSALNGAVGTYSGGKTDYRVGLEYELNADIMTYGEYSTGFKGGGVNPRPFFASQLLPFKPEVLRAAEIGIKSDLLNRTMRTNLAVFYNHYDSIQLTALTCPEAPVTPCALPVNAGNADIKGAELEWSYRPVAALTLDATASWLGFDYTSIAPDAGTPAADGVPASGVTRGMIAPYTPRQKYSFGIQYAIGVGDFGSLTPRLDWSYQSDFYTNAVNGPTNLIAGYALLNGRITWRNSTDTWEAALWGTNLLNHFYYVNSLDLNIAPSFVVTGQPGPPRMLAVTLKRNFK